MTDWTTFLQAERLVAEEMHRLLDKDFPGGAYPDDDERVAIMKAAEWRCGVFAQAR